VLILQNGLDMLTTNNNTWGRIQALCPDVNFSLTVLGPSAFADTHPYMFVDRYATAAAHFDVRALAEITSDGWKTAWHRKPASAMYIHYLDRYNNWRVAMQNEEEGAQSLSNFGRERLLLYGRNVFKSQIPPEKTCEVCGGVPDTEWVRGRSAPHSVEALGDGSQRTSLSLVNPTDTP
jgi:hypothetical protein